VFIVYGLLARFGFRTGESMPLLPTDLPMIHVFEVKVCRNTHMHKCTNT